ncbi:hypothetical protein [Cylindrospermopsis raciborskii]|uniref:hypothetical protein n=1 Tax=Cylindrospermopsis raciborskii TaxID=77022 RepID=UPI00115DFB48|nr:hypothetical protein [Cylindrospermopsis raciborskii]
MPIRDFAICGRGFRVWEGMCEFLKRAIARSECFANALGVLRKCAGVTAMRSQPMFQNHK